MIEIAIAVNGGHVSRALDFYNAVGKYFIIGGTIPWEDETAPIPPTVDDFKLIDVVGLKKVDNCHLVIPDASGTIQYRKQNWKIVSPHVETKVTSGGVTAGSKVIPVESVAGIIVGGKLRINSLYEGKVTSISGSTRVTIDTAAPQDIPAGSTVLGGAPIDGAKHVYIDCYLNYDEFPLVTYRQIGLCTSVTPNTANILRAAKYTKTGISEYTSLGTLEILDNRMPSSRDISQRELLSMIIEF